jgi:serine/threonine protein kinase
VLCRHFLPVPRSLLIFLLPYINNIFCSCYHEFSPNDWRYTVRRRPIVNETVTIHKTQYRFDKKLGQGAFGSVYAARRLTDGKSFIQFSFINSNISFNIGRSSAIKVVSLALLDSATAVGFSKSFLTEIKMAKRLAKTSINIVHMYDFDFHQQTGLAFIVMELGQYDLEHALTHRPQLSSHGRKTIWRQLVNIADALHSRQIVRIFYLDSIQCYCSS